MSECIKKFYIENSDLKLVESFDDGLVLKENSIYEVFRIIDGIPLFIEKHYTRLENSFKLINKDISMTLEKLKVLVKELCNSNEVYTGNMKLVCNLDGNNNMFLYFIKHQYPTKENYKKGVSTVSFNFNRENPNAKLVKGNYKKITQQIRDTKGVYELVLVDDNGSILEGSKSNIFMIQGETVITSPKEKVLKGITREIIYELCKENNITIIEKAINLKDLYKLDAMFISGTSPKVLPISSLDGTKYSTENEILKLIVDEYNKKIETYISTYKYE
ncbi:aminotransferase class IV [Clostridium sediminicola]|uniref:aminotransferase class IV n=1 Tax=Clostridium sediminicola TaxID=3114879 RepID=UPI0031F26AEB